MRDYAPFMTKIHLFFKFTLAILWTAAHWPSVLWLLQKTSPRPDAVVIMILLGVALGVSLHRARVNRSLYKAKPALLLLCIAACGSLLNSLTINFPQAQIMLWILGVYGWLGLNETFWPGWSRHLGVVLLIAFALPFYLEFSSWFGFALRLLTASFVEKTLTLAVVIQMDSTANYF